MEVSHQQQNLTIPDSEVMQSENEPLEAQLQGPKPWNRFLTIGVAATIATLVIYYLKSPILSSLNFIPQSLSTAFAKRDLETIKNYINQDLQVNARKRKAFHQDRSDLESLLNSDAAQEKIGKLISEGFDINYRSENGMVPLHVAASRNNQDVVEALIANGVGVNPTVQLPMQVRNQFPQILPSGLVVREGMTPLHLTESRKIAELLIAKGANVKVSDERGRTPLHAAASKNSAELVSLFLAKGANSVAKDRQGNTPLHLAQSVEVASLLITNINTPNQAGKTPLHLARSPQLAAFLIAKGANVNTQDKQGNTPLHLAFLNYTALAKNENYQKQIVELLLRKGADVNIKNKKGDTPLYLALLMTAQTEQSYLRKKHLIKALIWKGANMNIKNNRGDTPLQAVVKWYGNHPYRRELIDLLVGAGADINTGDGNGLTLLHQMAWEDENLVRFLIAKGANVDAIDNRDYTPILTAGNQDITLLLMAAGADIKVIDRDGNTLLHKAAKNNWKKVVQQLLFRGPINPQNNQGETPLRVAGNNKEIIQLLKRHGGSE